ncbi:unnamed protein product [Polarella glacialis]|uniref:AP2/ERF domain-containing protein n=1 Tax=Polarella glacialis TaxID=89957 RepID=A0A813HBL8_POLGL|nr:unnamed protein product [Polarella glacialis]
MLRKPAACQAVAKTTLARRLNRAASCQALRIGAGGGLKGTAVQQSAFRGVVWEAKARKWRATISPRNSPRRISLGSFDDEQTAAAFYDCASILLRGARAKVNLAGRTLTEAETAHVQLRLNQVSQRQLTSSFRGVSARQLGRWHSQITINRITHCLGKFESEESAARSYDIAFRKSLPSRALLLRMLNFPFSEDYFTEETWEAEPIPEGRSSRFMGVSVCRGKFAVKIGSISVGSFVFEVDAARMFDQASMALGRRTNFHPAKHWRGISSGTGRTADSMSSLLAQVCPSSVALTSASWIAVRGERLAQTADGVAGAALAKLQPAIGKVCNAEFSRQKKLWNEYLEADKRRLRVASDWRFEAADPIQLRPWQNHKDTCEDLETISASDLPSHFLQKSLSNCQSDYKQESPSRLISQLNVVFNAFQGTQNPEKSWLFGRFSGSEAQSRMLINVLLLDFCRQHELSLSPEEPLPPTAPVPGVADYVLRRGNEVVAVVEAKCCLPEGPSGGREAWTSVLAGAAAQTLALIAGIASPKSEYGTPWGVVTDSRRWLLIGLPADGHPVIQRWSTGSVLLELSGPEQLKLLLECLGQLLTKGAHTGESHQAVKQKPVLMTRAGSLAS